MTPGRAYDSLVERRRRGWNGTLVVGDTGVALRRGLRGLLIRKRRDADVEIPLDRIERIRYAPSRGVVGYVQFVEPGTLSTNDYLQTIRDPHTVTFASRSNRWLRVAEELAARTGARLEAAPAAPYWSSVFGSAGGGRKLSLRLVVHFAAVPVALLVGLVFHSTGAFIAALAIAFGVSFVLGRTVLR
jgi:Domain of unknown function (DUF4429)